MGSLFIFLALIWITIQQFVGVGSPFSFLARAIPNIAIQFLDQPVQTFQTTGQLPLKPLPDGTARAKIHGFLGVGSLLTSLALSCFIPISFLQRLGRLAPKTLHSTLELLTRDLISNLQLWTFWICVCIFVGVGSPQHTSLALECWQWTAQQHLGVGSPIHSLALIQFWLPETIFLRCAVQQFDIHQLNFLSLFDSFSIVNWTPLLLAVAWALERWVQLFFQFSNFQIWHLLSIVTFFQQEVNGFWNWLRGALSHLRAPCTVGSPCCKPGPNSRRLHPILFVWLGFACLFTIMDAGRSEGCIPAMGNVGTSVDMLPILTTIPDVKQHGPRPAMCGTAPKALNPKHASAVVKRSLFRAQRRAHQFGMTWYRGRCLRPEDFITMGMKPMTDSLPAMRFHDASNSHRLNKPKKRLTCFSWNGGGLAAHKLDEIKAWLSLQHIMIAVLTETRWSFQSTWTDGSWHHIHSADPDNRGTGVLILISKSLCPASDLRWNDVLPGRILHVRVMNATRNLDVFGCYQHVFRPDHAQLQKREKFWQLLEHQLTALPSRNTVTVLGDFNCSLPTAAGVSGPCRYAWQQQQVTGTCHSDNLRFLQVLKLGGMVALNSWNAKMGPTYRHMQHHSRIDFVCARQQQADGLARQVQYLWDAPFVPLGRVGHVPMIFSIARYWIPPPHAQHGLTPNQRERGRLAKLADSSDWQNFLTACAAPLHTNLTRVLTSALPEFTQVHEVAMHEFAKAFPAVSCISKHDPWQSNNHVLTKWEHRKLANSLLAFTLRHMFVGWYHVIHFFKLNKLHRRFAMRLRRLKFAETVKEAHAAALNHDTRQLFNIIHRHSPKVPHRRMQLRNDHGALMTISEERSVLIQFVQQTWDGPHMPAFTSTEPPGVPFCIGELTAALRRIPSGKAVAPPCAPGIIWNSFAHLISPILHAVLSQWWSTGHPWIPEQWRSGWLQLIPKPSKPPTNPRNLRPLAIQCPLGKAVFGLLIQKASAQADAQFRRWPIWAFLALRSTQDPLAKVAAHCRDVRNLVASQKSTPHARAAMQPRLKCYGGLQVFLDLERAFDNVNRTKLFGRLHQINISPNIIQLLQCWHVDTSYYVTHGGECTAVRVNKGLRQGCKGAPFLWNCLILLLMYDLSDHIPATWIQSHLTAYADDIHVGGHFRTFSDLQQLIQCIGKLFSLLAEFDLHLNPNKSVAILTLHGSQSRKARARHVQRDQTGEVIKIPGDHGMTLVPIRKSTVYLGCIMSYKNFEDSSIWHRVKLANIGFSRLRRWLCCNKFPRMQRLRLWQTCILPIMHYGVFAIGLTPKGTRHMIIQISRMLRTIARDHSFHTGHTNEQVFTAFSLPAPADLLIAAADTLQRSVSQRLLLLQHDDIACTLSWNHLTACKQMVLDAQATLARQRAETALSAEVTSQPSLYCCTQCSFCTNHVAAFRNHCTLQHGMTMFRIHNHDLSLHAINGLPECKHCSKIFATWRSFRTHLERGCQVVLPGPAACTGIPDQQLMASGSSLRPDPGADVSMRQLTDAELRLMRSQTWSNRVLHMVATDTLHNLEHEWEACQWLSKHCLLCGLQLSRTQDLHHHYRTEHAAYWPDVPNKSLILTRMHSSESPCPHCGGYFRQHQCPVWTQISVLALYGGGLLELPDALDVNLTYRCDICLEPCADASQLTLHLQQKHKLAGITFNVARDSLNSEAACAHCGSVHTTMEGLRTHITRGHCQSFNPAAVAETAPITQDWLNICVHGCLLEHLQPPKRRLHLTIRCQQCGQAYSRAGDLAHHLMNCHSHLWRQSQRVALILNDLIFARRGCVCNPQINKQRSGHMCVPLRQIGMMFRRLQNEVFMPVQVPDAIIQQMIHHDMPDQYKHCLATVFTTRSFVDLWTRQEVMHILSTMCTMCGQAFHPGLLCRHLHEAHVCGHRFADFYTEELVPKLMQAFEPDHCCCMCGQIFNLPADETSAATAADRRELVQVHLRGNCPVLLQSALLLGTALNGGGLGHEWMGRGSPGPDQGDLSIPAAHLRPEPKAVFQPKGETTSHRPEASGSKRRSRSTRQRTAIPPDEVPSDSGTIGPAARAQLERLAKQRLFHPLLPAGGRGSFAGDDSRDQEMEPAAPEGRSLGASAAAPAPLSVASDGSSEPGHKSVEVPARGPSPSGLLGQENPFGGSELAVSEVECRPESPCDRQEKIGEHGQDATAPGRASAGLQRPDPGSQIPGSSDQPRTENSPLETSAEHEDGSTLRTSAGTHPLFHMAAGGDVFEGTLPQTELSGGATALHDAGVQGPGQGQAPLEGQDQLRTLDTQRLGLLASSLSFANDSNWCFANTTMYCLLWALLSLKGADSISWGPRFEHLIQLLHISSDCAIPLAEIPWFDLLLKDWGRPPAQQDCSEFVHFILQWISSPAIDMSWHRRCDIETGTITHDQSHACLPLFLQFPPDIAKRDSCTLTDLMTHWCQVDGMKAALLRSAPIICVHVDRMIDSSDGQIEKSSCAIDVDTGTAMPHFIAEDLQTDTAEYILIAAAAHLGIDAAGHYQAALKVRPTVQSEDSAIQWLITQDHCKPAPAWQIPILMQRNFTVLWLLRTDCLTLLSYHAAMPGLDPADQDDVLEENILTLLRSDVSQSTVAPSSTET